jgi:radical SAM superfamily enzyme YgiQ (UPF0313 family)
MNVLMVYPKFPDTFWSFKYALRFIRKKASQPPLGLVTIAAMLPKKWNKKLVDMNVNELTDEQIAWADMIMVSAMVVQRSSSLEVIHRCKQAGKLIVAGGPLFTGEYEKFPEVDHFILNEGEITVPEFLKDYENHSLKRIYTTTEHPDMSVTPIPDWSLIDMKYYDSMSIQFSRGCPFKCDFCNITAMLGHTPRVKSAEQIIKELDLLYSLGWRSNVFFVDDNFIGNKKILKDEVLPALIEWRKGKKGYSFITEASVNLADDPELMQMMRDAGFVSVFVGIETPDDEGLTECHKTQNKNRNLIDAVHRLQSYGLQVMGGFIVGFDSDQPSIFNRQIDFIQKSGIVTAMVGLLQAPYGTELYDRLDKEGRLIKEFSGDNADGTTNIIPKMDIKDLTAGYKQIINEIYSSKGFYTRVENFLKHYNPPVVKSRITFNEVGGLFKSIWLMGICGTNRDQYWKLFFKTLFSEPKKFPMVITLSVYGFHFKKVAQEDHIIPVAA